MTRSPVPLALIGIDVGKEVFPPSRCWPRQRHCTKSSEARLSNVIFLVSKAAAQHCRHGSLPACDPTHTGASLSWE
jgi:hypothetical protein